MGWDRVVHEPHAPDGALLGVVDIALVVGATVDVEAHRVLLERGGIGHGVNVGGPVDVSRPGVHGGPERLEPQGRPRGLAVAREREPPALDPGPAILALVSVDRRRRSPRPAEHEDLHVAVLVDEMPRVAPGGEPHEAIERCRLDPVGREEAAHLGRVDGAVAPRADLPDEVGHGHGDDAGHRARSSPLVGPVARLAIAREPKRCPPRMVRPLGPGQKPPSAPILRSSPTRPLALPGSPTTGRRRPRQSETVLCDRLRRLDPPTRVILRCTHEEGHRL